MTIKIQMSRIRTMSDIIQEKTTIRMLFIGIMMEQTLNGELKIKASACLKNYNQHFMTILIFSPSQSLNLKCKFCSFRIQLKSWPSRPR